MEAIEIVYDDIKTGDIIYLYWIGSITISKVIKVESEWFKIEKKVLINYINNSIKVIDNSSHDYYRKMKFYSSKKLILSPEISSLLMSNDIANVELALNLNNKELYNLMLKESQTL